jgi:hypothetical protein
MTVTFTELKVKVKEALATCKSTIEAELDNYALSSALAEYAKKATTLAGYGITDAYTKAEVDSKVASASSGGSVDLSNYYTKSETNAAITAAISAITDGDSVGY